MTTPPPRALVVLAEGAEEMEATIAIDVLRRAGVDVTVAGLDGSEAVACSRGVRIVPDAALSDVRGPWSAVVLPGGAEGARRLGESAAVGTLLREHVASGALVGAICAAPTALARHAVFAGRAMTCHPSVREIVAEHGAFAARAVVEDGQLVTSRGPGTAFAFALALVARLVGREQAEAIRNAMVLDASDRDA